MTIKKKKNIRERSALGGVLLWRVYLGLRRENY